MEMAARVDREDIALIEAVRRGDRRAFEKLYGRFAGPVFSLALRITRDRLDADDVTLETLWQVWNGAGRYDAARGGLATWVFMIARSRALDCVRARRSGVKPSDCAELELLEIAAPDDPERDAALGERAAAVRRACGALPAEQRIVIELAYWEGLSHSEIAARLRQSLGTVKTRTRLGLLKLQHALRAELAPHAELERVA
jgi:RNA polymerase sigma-70 factor (ECF subfamily)